MATPRLANGRPNPVYQAAYYRLNRKRIREAQRLRLQQKPSGYKRLTRMQYRQMVLALLEQRDGRGCGICGLLIAGKTSIDHIVPRCQGGKEEAVNLQLAHWECNHRKERRPWPSSG